MTGKIIVSGQGKLRVFGCPGFEQTGETLLLGSGALCTGGEKLFAASDEENVIYRLNVQTLLPEALLTGGPGMRALCLSADGKRLFVLLADADSVLMLCAKSGAPLFLARAGVNPQNLRLDDTGERLVVAGGKDRCAHILCSRTLCLIDRYPLKGICVDAGLRNGRVRAMQLSKIKDFVPGKLITSGAVTLLLDRMTDRLFACMNVRGSWRLVCSGARDAAIVWDKDECGRA